MPEEEKQTIKPEKPVVSTKEKKEKSVVRTERITPAQENTFLLKIGIMIFLTFTCCALLFFALLRFDGFASVWKQVMKALEPIIIGLVLAYLLNPIMRFVERYAKKLLCKRIKDEMKLKKWARGIGIVGTVIFLLTMLALLIAAIAPTLGSSIMTLVDTMPDMVDNFLATVEGGILGKFEFTDIFSDILTKVTEYLETWAKEKLLPQAQTYLAQITTGVISVVKALFNFVIGIIVMVYVLSIQEKLVGQGKKIIYAIFKPKRGNIIVQTMHKTNEIFGGFISGKILDSIIIGLLCYIGCSLLRIPDAMLVSVIIGVTNVIPVFGPFIGAIPMVLLTVIQSPIHALYLVIFVVVLQQVDGNIIGPKILGNSTGLSSFWVMFAILIGGGLFGFLGMLIGIPFFAVIYYLVRRVVNYSIKKRNLPVETEVYVKAVGVDETTNSLVYAESKKKRK